MARSDSPNCLICNCEKTMPLDAAKLSKALGRDIGPIHSHLCRSQLSAYEAALAGDEPFFVACTQEAPLFQEIAEEAGKPNQVGFVNIRENAGWSKDADAAHAKIAALIRSAAYESKPARLKSINSDGMCLVYGAGQQAFEAARLLSRNLSVTLLLSADDDILPPNIADVPIYRGTIGTASGSFGAFRLTVDNYAPSMPSSRDGLGFLLARDGAQTECSVILDLSGNAPLFAGHQHRDGYRRVDPGDPAAVLRAVMDLSEMVGEFEKPIYVDYDAETCAHSRSNIAGCSKCLDVCPAGAISDAGDTIAIDSGICGGCGACHAVCPTGSISYQYPGRSDIAGRAQSLLGAYDRAGGEHAVLLIHGEPFGSDRIAAMARYGRGLPAHVLPFAMHSPTTFGHVEMAAALASGAQQIVFLCDPERTEELQGLEAETALIEAILSALGLGGDRRCSIIVETDPDRIEDHLWSLPAPETIAADVFTPVGSKRDVARMAFGKLHARSADRPSIISLPQAAPYGRVDIDQTACTLCMACASACPSAAIVDTPGEPKLRFVESACVQCGLCVNTCPEKALTLVPQLDFTPAAMQPVTLYEEEPFACISCGTPFATRSTIERITRQLAGKHSMFADDERSRLIKMCENCRVEAQANSSTDPFAVGTRPRPRTTEDYLEAEKSGLSVDDFLMDD